MNLATAKAKLLSIRAEVDELIDKLADDAEEGGDSPWMTVAEYATHARVSVETVRRAWLAKGMPHAKRPIRIHAVEADAWRKSR